jgi:putative oxidoreductase
MMKTRIDRAQPHVLGLFRIVVGLLFACHGAGSLFGWFGGEELSAGSWPDWYAGVIELVAGTLVLVGLGTRTAAFLGSGAMAFAYFDVHQHRALLPIENGGEASVFFCWALLLLVFHGPGTAALDQVLRSHVPAAWRRPAKAPAEDRTVLPV